MSIQEEAKQYAEKITDLIEEKIFPRDFMDTKEMALIHVREILDPKNDKLDCDMEFYKLVEQELIKMK